MIKLKKATLGAFLSVAAIAATSCGQAKKEVEFWSAFGSKYGAKLQTIVDGVSEKLGIEIEHKAISGYDNILSDMTAALNTHIKNLYLSGQFMRSPGGLPFALSSGYHAVQRICRQESIKYLLIKQRQLKKI